MEFAVGAAFRNKGAEKEMFSKACQTARDRDRVQIEAACNQLRKDANRFYLKEGMNNFHFKFSRSLTEDDTTESKIGR